MKTLRTAGILTLVLLAMLALAAGPVAAQQKQPNIVIIWGDDIGQSNISAYSHGPDGLPDAQHRPRRQGRHDVHRLLCRAELHRRPGVVHHRPVRPAHRPDQGRPAGRHARAAEGRPDDRRAAEAARLCDRPVRQEPPGRPQRVPAHRARLRRVLRQPLPPERRGRAGTAGLPEGPGVPRQVRPARRDGLQGLGHGRPDRRPALRQGRQAGLQGHRPADQEADGDDRRRHRRPGRGLHPAAEQGRQAGLRLGELHPHALPHPHQAGEHRPVGALAEPVPRHHDRPRQERRHRSSRRWTTWASRTTPSSCTAPTTART